MRHAMLLLLAALAAGPALAAPPAKPAAARAVPVTLAGTMLSFGAKGPVASFGLRRADTIALVAASLGKPSKTGTYPDCGQGIAIGYARFRGGLELAFIAGKFVGWTLDKGGSSAMRTARGVGLGTPRAVLKMAYPDVSIDPDSSLGVMFDIDENLGGFLADEKSTAKVISLHAGQVCMVS